MMQRHKRRYVSFRTFFEHTMIKAIPSGFGFPAHHQEKMRLQAMDNLRPFTPKRSHNSMSFCILMIKSLAGSGLNRPLVPSKKSSQATAPLPPSLVAPST